MNNKKERAIAWITRELEYLRRATYVNGCEMKPEWAEQIDVWETALEVLHPVHVEYPLTIEQLLEIQHGKIKDVTLQSICNGANEIASSPAHIDREAWEPCIICETCASCKYSCYSAKEKNSPCYACEYRSEYKPRNYCPFCCRPLTDEAWTLLEKRLRG